MKRQLLYAWPHSIKYITIEQNGWNDNSDADKCDDDDNDINNENYVSCCVNDCVRVLVCIFVCVCVCAVCWFCPMIETEKKPDSLKSAATVFTRKHIYRILYQAHTKYTADVNAFTLHTHTHV